MIHLGKRLLASVFAALILSSFTSLALVGTSTEGLWPTNWPPEMEALRKSARTISVATGIQENIYEIVFTNRAQFEAVWPAIQKLKSPFSPVTVYKTNSAPPRGWGWILSNAQPSIRIYAPANSFYGSTETNQSAFEKLVAEKKILKAGEPWPQEVIGTNGTLPEFVKAQTVGEHLEWTPTDLPSEINDLRNRSSFLFRARIDLDVVVDDSIIQLADLQFPFNTPVHDDRLAVPSISSKTRASLTKDAQATFSRFVRGDPSKRGDTIPASMWGDTIKQLKPLRVINDRVNIKIVTAETEDIEAGFYVNLPISSYAPQQSDFIEFVLLNQPTDVIFGGLYRFKAIKKSAQ